MLRRLLVAAILCLAGKVAIAQSLEAPKGPVILMLDGAVSNTNQGEAAVFDQDMLEALGVQTLETTTSWTDGVVTFDGVLAADVLDRVGATGTRIEAVALNDYRVELEMSEMRKYPVLLALRMNGEAMPRRDKGPLWIVYPRDDYDELQDEAHNYKWVWQLKHLHIR